MPEHKRKVEDRGQVTIPKELRDRRGDEVEFVEVNDEIILKPPTDEERLGKLPRPTCSLSPCGDRSLLEGGALPQRHCAPQPRVWARPGFLLPSTLRAGAFRPAFDRLRGLSRRFNSRCPHALPRNGDGVEPFAVVVPEYRVRYNRTTGASLLVAPTLPDVYQEGSLSGDVVEVFNCMRTRFLPGLLALLAEAGGSALPIAEGYRKRAERSRELAEEMDGASSEATGHLGDAPDRSE